MFYQYAHRKCVQRWCNEKGNIICEICHQVCLPFVVIFRIMFLNQCGVKFPESAC